MADRSDSERPDSEEHGILDEERVDTSGIFLGGSTAQVDVAFPVPADDDDTIDEDFDESGHDRDVTHPDAAERADTAEAEIIDDAVVAAWQVRVRADDALGPSSWSTPAAVHTRRRGTASPQTCRPGKAPPPLQAQTDPGRGTQKRHRTRW